MKDKEKKETKRTDKKRSNVLRFTAFIIVAVGILLYIFRDFVNDFFIANIYDTFVKDIDTKITTVPVSIDTTDKIDYESINGNFALLSNTRFKVFDKGGKLKYEEAIVFSSPVIKSSKSLYLCFERGGKQLFLANNNKIVSKYQSENTITTAAISNNYIVAVYSTNNNNMTAVVYNKKFKEVYKYTTSDYYIQSAIISSNSNKLVLALVKTQNGLLDTVIKCMTLTSTEPVFTTDIEESLPISMEFTDNDTITIISSGKLININDKGKITGQNNFESKSADKFSAAKNSCTAVSFQDFSSSSSYSLSAYSMNGKLLFNQPLKSKAEMISVCGSRIAVLSSDNLTIYLKNGRKLLDLTFFQNVTKISLKKDKFILYENDKISYIPI